MISPNFQLNKALEIIRAGQLNRNSTLLILLMFYTLSVILAILEGIGALLLGSMFSGGIQNPTDSNFIIYLEIMVSQFNRQTASENLIFSLTFIFTIIFIVGFILAVTEGFIRATLQQMLQKNIYKSYIYSDWIHMNQFRVGNGVGTNTQEALAVAKYLMCLISAIYFSTNALVLFSIAAISNIDQMLLILMLGIPFALLMITTFRASAKLSSRLAVLRNTFSADIADRFSGLFQIHVENNFSYHLNQGLKVQKRIWKNEILTSIWNGVIGSSNSLLILFFLIMININNLFILNSTYTDISNLANLGILILLMRGIGNINNAISQFGNVSRLSGSLDIVLTALNTPAISVRQDIIAPIERVEIKDLSFNFNSHQILDGVNLTIKKGQPIILVGDSGSGKTTLANLIAGLYFPISGSISYVSHIGQLFNSTNYQAKVGYIAQDVYLFDGSLRDNLTCEYNFTDKQIWDVLELVDATKFLKELKRGLDFKITEGGRTLSGGQKRRLGIARIILRDPDILIFDEATAGLDIVNKEYIIKLINSIAKRKIVLIISHDEIILPIAKYYRIGGGLLN